MSGMKIRVAASAALRAALLVGTSLGVVALPAAAAQSVESGSLSGRVVDAGTGIRLQGALVRIPELDLRTSVDREGAYRLGFVPAGTYQMIVTYQNKTTQTRSVTISAGQATVENFDLADLASSDEIVVRGARPIAGSEAAAFSRQKASDNLINVVASDTIGRFPDQNVAAALSRLPGISVERDQGQERYVNLRGAPNKWTTISFNGLNVVSPEGRSSRFDTIPNAIVSSIEVTKAVTADMPAESIAGNVNIITRSPFDRPGLHFNGEVAGGFLQLGGGSQSNFAGSVSNTFMDDKFGFVFSGTFYQRNQVTDNIENRFEYPGEAEGDNNLLWSRQTDTRDYHLVRENKGFTGRFDYRPSSDHKFYVESIFTEFTDHENRDQFIFDYDSDAPNGCYAITASPCNNTPTAGTVYGTQIDATFNTNDYRENIWTSTLAGDHFVAGWDLAWRANYTEAEDEFYAPARWRFASPSDPTLRPTVQYDYSDPDLPVTNLFETIDNGDGTYSAGNSIEAISSDMLELDNIERIDRNERTYAYTLRFDAEREGQLFNRPITFKTGMQYDSRIKKGRRTDTIFDADRDDALENGVDAAIYDSFDLPTFADIQRREGWPSDFPQYYVAFRYNDNAAMDIFSELNAAGATYVQPDESEESFYDVEETILAGYVQTKMEFDWGSVLAGVRVEQSENEGTALGTIDGTDGFVPFTASDDRVDVFPSVHVNWNLSDNQKIRVSLNSGLARADFDTRAPNFSVNDDEAVISGGNPFVDPEKTYGVDVYYEYYLEPLGIFSVGGFYKHIQDPLVGVNSIFGSDQLNTGDIDRSGYEFNTTGNGESGYYYGFEATYAQQFAFLPEMFTFLPEWTDGFGINSNFVWTDSEVDLGEDFDNRKAPLEGASDITYNVSGYWEKYGLSLRANWQWRTDWINSYSNLEDNEGNIVANDRYWDQLGRLSVGARYQVSDNIEWFFDANNLTNQFGRRIRETSRYVYEVEQFGTRYLMGVRVNY